jgi:hypothetical protein
MAHLTGLKQTYVAYIINLLSVKSDTPELCDYAKQLITLLKNIINIGNNKILTELAPNLESIFVIYIFDLTELLNQQQHFDFDSCRFRYQNLATINSHITNFTQQYKQNGCYDSHELDQLKKMLLLL